MRKSPTVAVLLSSFFPGLGQFYNLQRQKAFLFAMAALVTAFGPLSPLDVDIDIDDPAVGLRRVLLASAPFLAVSIWSMVDAYLVARRTQA